MQRASEQCASCAEHTWGQSHRRAGSHLSLTHKRCHPALPRGSSPQLPTAATFRPVPEAELGDIKVCRSLPLLSLSCTQPFCLDDPSAAQRHPF